MSFSETNISIVRLGPLLGHRAKMGHDGWAVWGRSGKSGLSSVALRIGEFPRRFNGWQAAGESESSTSQPALTGASQKKNDE